MSDVVAHLLGCRLHRKRNLSATYCASQGNVEAFTRGLEAGVSIRAYLDREEALEAAGLTE